MASDMFKKRVEITAKRAVKDNIALFTYNTRGAGIVTYINKEKTKEFGGMAYEEIYEAYYDIKACIKELVLMGFENIFLQGHSLGATKTVYVYNKLLEEKDMFLEKIKGIILLSLVDIPNVQRYFLKDSYAMYLAYAQSKKAEDKELELMPRESFIHPISVKTYLRLFKENENLDFARYQDPKYNFKELNNIKVPLMMRWGNNNEMIIQKAEDLVEILKNKVKNNKADIFFVSGADHGYTGKEEVLANQIVNFVKGTGV